MRILQILTIVALVVFVGCEPATKEVEKSSPHVAKLAPLIDPAKLDSLKGKRAATPRLRKACYWLEVASREGADLKRFVHQAHAQTGYDDKNRESIQSAALIRNRDILEKLGCLDSEGMEKLRRGKAPTITKGPYAGELATGDHIIPRSICPELDNCLFNLEFLPETLNQRKSNKIGKRQIDLAKKWSQLGILSNQGLNQVKRRFE
ncbi:hypothetical protein N9891_00160 [bacterium]|nr:hypothetical protein [bacterium]